MKNISFLLFVLLSLFLLFGVNAATVSHPASEITPGTFPAGNFTFQGNVEVQKNNEVFLNIRNTEASGRQYALVSAGSSGGIGTGKFSVYDKTADASRLTIDSSGNVGIGTTSPTQKLDVIGYMRGSSGLCIGEDCRTVWPSSGITSESDPTVTASVKDGVSWTEISGRPSGLVCQTVFGSPNLFTSSATCPDGFWLTGGGCDITSDSGALTQNDDAPSGNTYNCNTGAQNSVVRAFAFCCKIQ